MSVGTSDAAGTGRLTLHLHGDEAVFSELSYSYPLKLLSPRVAERAVAIAYVLTYGGGLVGGDRIHLNIDVGPGAVLLLLTQGSTKVFKRRAGTKASKNISAVEDTADGETTIQNFDASVCINGLLLLLPDPVTCFSKASYNQRQIFKLERGASIVLLDWITAGRMSRGEEWEFSRYFSTNEVWVNGKRVARDVMLLEDHLSDPKHLPRRTLKDRLDLYSCYASAILHGPLVEGVIASLTLRYGQISVLQQSAPPTLVWSLSQIEEGCVIRVAAKETEMVKSWLRDELKGLEKIVGIDVYSKAFV